MVKCQTGHSHVTWVPVSKECTEGQRGKNPGLICGPLGARPKMIKHPGEKSCGLQRKTGATYKPLRRHRVCTGTGCEGVAEESESQQARCEPGGR